MGVDDLIYEQEQKAVHLLLSGDHVLAQDIIDSIYKKNLSHKDIYAQVGGFYREQRDWAKAAEWMERDYSQGRMSWGWQLRYAEVLAEIDKEDKALNLVAQVYEGEPEARDGYARLGWRYSREKDWARAQALMARDAVQARLSPEWRVHYAQVLYRLGNEAQADSHIGQAYQEDEQRKDGYARLGGICREQRDWAKAAEWMERDYSQGRMSWGWKLRYAEVLAELEKENEALDLIDNVYKMESCASDGYARIGYRKDQKGDFESAVELMEKDCTMNRMSPAWYMHYAKVKLHVDAYKDALELICIAYKLDPNLKDGYARLALDKHKYISWEELKDLMRQDFILDRMSWEMMLKYAEILIEYENESAAVLLVNKAYSENNNLMNGFARLGNKYRIRKKWNSAEKLMRKDYQSMSITYEYTLRYAEVLLELGKYDEAIKIVEKVYDNSSDVHDGYARLGWSFAKKNKLSRAIYLMEKDWSRGMISPAWMLNLAKLYFQTGNISKADEMVCNAYSKEINIKDGYANLGLIYYENGDSISAKLECIKDLKRGRISKKFLKNNACMLADLFVDTAVNDNEISIFFVELSLELKNLYKNELAILYISKVISIHGDNPDFLYTAANIYDCASDLDSAIEYYEKSIKTSDKVSVDWYSNLGNCYRRRGLIANPEIIYSHTYGTEMDDFSNQYDVAIYYEKMRLWDEAKLQYENIMSQERTNEDVLCRVGIMYECNYELDKAELFYKKSLMQEQNNAYCYYRLGIVLERQGKLEESLYAYKMAINKKAIFSDYWFYRITCVLIKIEKYKEAYLMLSEIKTCSAYNISFFNQYLDRNLPDDYSLLHVSDNNINKSECLSISEMRSTEECKKYISMMDGNYIGMVLSKTISITLVELHFSNDLYSLKMMISYNDDIYKLVPNKLVLKNRTPHEREEIAINKCQKVTIIDRNHSLFEVSFSPNITEMRSLYYDIYVKVDVIHVNYFDTGFDIKIKKVSDDVIARMKPYPLKYSVEDKGRLFYPYVTAGGKNVAFINRLATEYDDPKYYKIENDAIREYLDNKEELDGKNTWLICEKFSKTAQDNAFYFFKYAVERKKEVYYVIEKDSPDRIYLNGYEDNVVEFMSKKHMLLLLSCELLISSETRGHFYAWRRVFGKFRDAVFKKPYVFLQHGLTAMKKNDHNLSSASHLCSADKFVVTSNFEKEIILENNFLYNENDLIVSGFPRWQGFVDKSDDNSGLFLMPTWRNWLDELDVNDFIESSYFTTYRNFLNSSELLEVLNKYDTTLNFYLHPKIIQNLCCFEQHNERVKIIDFGMQSIRDLLMSSRILITDYSSVAWDFIYLKKPVVFFHFDQEKYIKYHGSHIDLNDDLPWKPSYTLSELITNIDCLLSNYEDNKRYAEVVSDNIFKDISCSDPSEKIYDEIIFSDIMNKGISAKVHDL